MAEQHEGTDYPCPNCGSTEDWLACYCEATSQHVKLVVGEDGGPEIADYLGDGKFFDSLPDEAWLCGKCDFIITLGVTSFATVEEHRVRNAAAELLDAAREALASILKYVPETEFAPRDALRAAIAKAEAR